MVGLAIVGSHLSGLARNSYQVDSRTLTTGRVQTDGRTPAAERQAPPTLSENPQEEDQVPTQDQVATQGQVATIGQGFAPSDLAMGLRGGPHDFTGQSHVTEPPFGTGEADLCLPCHQPHTEPAALSLRITRPRQTGRHVAEEPEIRLSESSLLCLSCHDGIVASDIGAMHSVTSRLNGPGDLDGPGIARGSGALTTHPVGIRYPVGRQTYHPASLVSSRDGLPLPDQRIQCTTCHDPHNRGRHEGMLVRSNEGSRLCLSCHRL